MRGWRGMATGALALITLQVLVQPDASRRVSGLPDHAARAVRSFLDPSIPTLKSGLGQLLEDPNRRPGTTRPNPSTGAQSAAQAAATAAAR